MSTTSLSAEPAKLRDVSQKHHVAMKFFHLYEIFICMAFYLYGIFICMRFSSVWDFHLYGFFICMEFLLPQYSGWLVDIDGFRMHDVLH
jgi:hypothetical protein